MDFDFTELKGIIEQFVLFFQTFFKAVIAMIGDIGYGFAGYPEETTAAPETTTEERQRPR